MLQQHKAKVIDFTQVDIYPDKYQAKKTKTGYTFQIRSIVIEYVDAQADRLASVGDKLFLGDYVKVDTSFGHYTGRPGETEDPQKWESFPLKAELKVQQIIPIPDTNEIRLIVRPHLFRV